MRENEDSLMAALFEALPYVNRFSGKTVVVKLGGSAFGGRDTTLQDVVTLKSLGVRPVVVHGGGAEISSLLKRLGAEPKFVRGLRVTDEATIDAVVMVLAGKVNKELVAALEGLGAPAIGLSGIDGRLLVGRIKDPELGLVGDVTQVNLKVLEMAAEAGFIPVVAPLAVSEEGRPLNLNGDTAAGEIAAALGAAKMIFLTDVEGIRGKDGQTIGHLTRGDIEDLIASGVVSGGMIPKVQACVTALRGAERAHIIDGRVPHALVRELYTDRGVGTMITA